MCILQFQKKTARLNRLKKFRAVCLLTFESVDSFLEVTKISYLLDACYVDQSIKVLDFHFPFISVFYVCYVCVKIVKQLHIWSM